MFMRNTAPCPCPAQPASLLVSMDLAAVRRKASWAVSLQRLQQAVAACCCSQVITAVSQISSTADVQALLADFLAVSGLRALREVVVRYMLLQL